MKELKEVRMKMRRSKLYMPGNKERYIIKALSLKGIARSDVIILDLENSVAKQEKDTARTLVRKALTYFVFGDIEKTVRINPIADLGLKDLEQIIPAGPDVILIPKCETRWDIFAVEEIISGEEIIRGLKIKIFLAALIETPLGVENAYEIISASDRLVSVCFGAQDYIKELNVSPDSETVKWAKCRVINAAAACGVQVSDTVFTNLKDMEGLRKATLAGKKLGFTGKSAIHPDQVPIINQIYTPTEKEILWAKKIVEAYEKAVKKGIGAIEVDGEMVDEPVSQRAKRILEIAKGVKR